MLLLLKVSVNVKPLKIIFDGDTVVVCLLLRPLATFRLIDVPLFVGVCFGRREKNRDEDGCVVSISSEKSVVRDRLWAVSMKFAINIEDFAIAIRMHKHRSALLASDSICESMRGSNGKRVHRTAK